MDLRARLPNLLPDAIAWAEEQFQLIQKHGHPLPEQFLPIAHAVGVKHPELVRVAAATHLPLPLHPELRAAAIQAGLLGPGMVGLTLGYGIVIVNGHASLHLLSHELRHVHQYEAAGSIATFLPRYLAQIVEFGYRDAPYEQDARAHEIAP